MTDDTHPHDSADAPADHGSDHHPDARADDRPDESVPVAAQPAASELEPLPVPMRRIVEIGILGWLVALLVVLLVPVLHEGDRDWWPWTCVAGIALGGIGWAYLRRGRGNAKGAG